LLSGCAVTADRESGDDPEERRSTQFECHTDVVTPTQQFITQLTTAGIAALAVLATLTTVYVNDRRVRLASRLARLDDYLREQRKVTSDLLGLGVKIMSDVGNYWNEPGVDTPQIQRCSQDVNTLNHLSLELAFLSGGSILADAAERHMVGVTRLVGMALNVEDKATSQQRFDECISECLRSGRRVYHIASIVLTPTITMEKPQLKWPDTASVEAEVDELERRYPSSS
jgi:hypothetical protein